MGKCPYCKAELHLEDFFDIVKKETKKGKIKTRIKQFKGESLRQEWIKMWVCPSCDTVLGFSEHAWASG